MTLRRRSLDARWGRGQTARGFCLLGSASSRLLLTRLLQTWQFIESHLRGDESFLTAYSSPPYSLTPYPYRPGERELVTFHDLRHGTTWPTRRNLKSGEGRESTFTPLHFRTGDFISSLDVACLGKASGYGSSRELRYSYPVPLSVRPASIRCMLRSGL